MHTRSAFACLLLLALAVPARALTPEQALARFFAAEELNQEWFAPSFLAAVPFAQLAPVRARLTADLGAFLEAVPAGDRYLARFEEGTIPCYVQLDAESRFAGLRLLPPVPRLKSLEAVAERFEALPGTGHLLVRVDGAARLDLRAATPLAVGSAFKLVLLKALDEEVEAGRRAWSEVVELRAEDRPLGDGQLGTWPVGAPLTLHTAATLMISRSDNTATDLLLRVLGRERIEAADPSGRNRPFLSTLEAFRLKSPENAALLARWRAAGPEGRYDLLPEIAAAPLPSLEIFAEGVPRATDVEWFFTAVELCDLLAAVQELDLTGVNPGVVTAGDYPRVAFKGGSEPGVLNLTIWVRDDRAREICVCATRNAEEALDELQMSAVVTGVLAVLERE
jgi:hypothetical protein